VEGTVGVPSEAAVLELFFEEEFVVESEVDGVVELFELSGVPGATLVTGEGDVSSFEQATTDIVARTTTITLK
jgi:hypothetical protein